MPFSTSDFSKSLRGAAAGLVSLAAVGVAASAFVLAGCNATDPVAVTPVDKTITVISPIGGSFKMSEKLRIIVQADYSKFSSGLNYQLSTDSSKNWKLMHANVRKDPATLPNGIGLDTLDWDAVNDGPGDVPAGKPLLFRVIDYDKKHFVISAYFTLAN